MLTSKDAIIPKNLVSLAKKTPAVASGIVCADHDTSMESAKKAFELNLIKPIFIGEKLAIKEKAKKFNWNIDQFETIDASNAVSYTHLTLPTNRKV